MKCPACGSLKQLTPVSRRTATSVWRKRMCKNCLTNWITEENMTERVSIPKEAFDFLDNSMRKAPKNKKTVTASTKPPAFDTNALKDFRW